jgi:hypothetical protein
MVPAGALRGMLTPCLIAACAATGCGDAPSAAAPPPPPGVVASVLGVGSGSAQAPKAAIDPKALAEMVEAMPPPAPPTSASGTLVGTDTGITGTDKPEPPSDDGFVSLLPSWSASNAGSERDLRGTVYFDLVHQCRADDGSELPPEAVEIELVVDSKGHIDRSSVKAKALEPEHEKAAACMTRTLRTSEARMTPPRLDKPVLVRARVPSVD